MNPKRPPAGLSDLLFYWLNTFRERSGHYELIGLALAVAIGYVLWRNGVTRAALWRLLSGLAGRPGLAAIVIFCGSFVLFSLPTLATHHPISPMSSDEYGFLLIADTFRHGHLTNPAHPLWRHFENFYLLQQPTYTSKYWPAQPAAIAAGWILFGHPMHGVRLSGAIACVAMFWMLRAWFERRWALFGAFLAATSFVVFDWNQTYLGGDVALLGGALCFGALARITTAARPRDAAILGAGLALLANSRPFEGLLLGVCLGVALLFWIVRDGLARLGAAGVVLRVGLPLAAVIGANFIWIAAYDTAVTGHPLTLPYSLYIKQYEPVPLFLFQEPLHPLAATCTMVNYNAAVVDQFRSFQTLEGLAIEDVRRLLTWLVTLIALPALPFFARGVRGQLAARRWLIPAAIAVSVGITMIVFPYEPYYFAQLLPAVLIATVAGIRSLAGDSFAGLTGALLPVAQLMAVIGFVVKQAIAPSIGENLRERFERQLEATEGKHLVVVREHCNPANWGYVYNDANIDASKIVWARDLGPADDAALLAYFKDRRVWLLDAGNREPQLTPFPAP